MRLHKIVFDITTSNPITLDGNIVYGSDFHVRPINQELVIALDGLSHVVGSSTVNEIIEGKLVLKNVTYEQGNAFKKWVVKQANVNGQDISITITQNGESLDLGKGDGVAIVLADNCKFNIVSTKGLLVPEPPKVYTVTIPYTFKG